MKMNGIKKYFEILMAIATAVAVYFYFWGMSSVALAVGVFIISLWFYRQTWNLKKDRITVGISGILAFFISFGRSPSFSFINHCGVFLGAWAALVHLVAGIYHMMDRHSAMYSVQYEKKRLSAGAFFVAVATVAFIYWFVYFLAYYPGVLTNDSYVQLYQVIGITSYSNHHPWIHTMWLKLCYDIGMIIFADPQKAVAVCTIMQMVVFSCVYGYILTVLYRERKSNFLLALLFAYYVLWPVNAHNMVYIGKDNFFATIVSLFVVVLWQMVKTYQQTGVLPGRYWVAYAVIGFLMSTFRSNGWYAFLLCIPATLWFFKRIWRRALLGIGICVAAVLLFKGPIMSHFQVTSPDLVENLSIPLQQVARVIDIKGTEVLTTEEYELLSQIIDVESIPEIYYDRISDNIKNAIRDHGNQSYLKENIMKFAKLYLGLGLRNFDIYFDAFVCQTNGYYFPMIKHWVNHAQYAYGDPLVGVHLESLLPDMIAGRINNALKDYPNIPIYNLLWHIGVYVWITFIMLGYMLRSKQTIYPFIPILAIWCTLLVAAPVYAEFRYIQALILVCPFLCSVAVSERRCREI